MRRLSVHLALVGFGVLMLYWLITWCAALVGMAVALHVGYCAGRLAQRASTALPRRGVPALEQAAR